MRPYQDIVRAWAAEESLDDLSPEQRRAIGLIAAGDDAEREFEAAGSEFVLGIKSTDLFRRAEFSGGLVKAHDDSPVLSWLFSENKVDRAKDYILQDGWDFANYGFRALGSGRFEPTGKGNPVVLWGHAHGIDHMADVPIARTIGLRVEGGTRTIGDHEYAVNEYDFSATIYRLAKNKFIHSNSVGFRPTAIKELTNEEREFYGVGKFGRVFAKQELLEDSLCAVPCLPSALQNAVKSNDLKSKDADFMVAITDPTEREWERYLRRRARSFVSLSVTKSDDVAPADDRIARALESLAETQRALAPLVQLAPVLTSLARSITDLGGCLSAPRQVAQAPAPATTTARDDSKAGVEIVETLRTMRTKRS